MLIPRVDASILLPGNLIKQVTKPVVLTNLAECWPARHFWSIEYLASVHGDKRVALLSLPKELFEKDKFSATVGNSLYADHVRNAYVPFVRMPEQLSLAEFIRHRFHDYVFDIGDTSIARQLCVDAFGGPSGLPELFAADDLTQFTCGLGPAEDGVMFHAHTAAWNALMFGEKEWFFYSPDGFTGEAYKRLSMLGATSLVEALGLKGGGTAVTPQPMRCRQRPGEVVFVPDGWWHATISHTDTACLGGQRHKERLPQDWVEELLGRWPDSGLFLNAVAKRRGGPALFEAAIEREPVNLRFSLEYMGFLRDQGEYAKVVRIAQNFRCVMEDACRQSLLGRAELAAVLAQLAEVLYHTVEVAAAGATCALSESPEVGAGAAQAAFLELMQVSIAARSLIEEALGLDPGCPVARSLAEAIETRARAADFRKLPPGIVRV